MAEYFKLSDNSVVEIENEEFYASNPRNNSTHMAEIFAFNGEEIDPNPYWNFSHMMSEYGFRWSGNGTPSEQNIRMLMSEGDRRGEAIFPVSASEHDGRTDFYVGFPWDNHDGWYDGKFVGIARMNRQAMHKYRYYSKDDAKREVEAELKDFTKSYNWEVLRWQGYSPKNGYEEAVDGGKDYYYDSMEDMVEHMFPDAEHLGNYKSIEDCVEHNTAKLGVEKKTVYVAKEPAPRKSVNDINNLVAFLKEGRESGRSTGNAKGNSNAGAYFGL